ncbi:MAG: ribosome maturation factor RimM [bacterium]
MHHPNREEDFRIIGKVVAAHGLQGTLKIESWSDFPERFRTLTWVFLKQPSGQLSRHEVKNVRFGTHHVFMKLDGLVRREQAEEYRDSELLIFDKESWPLPPDRYYVSDLIEMAIVGTDGTELGRITDAQTGAAQDILVVEGPYGELLIPFVSEWVTEVDMTARRLRVANWQELIYPEECPSAD